MSEPARSRTQIEREGTFARMVSAFTRNDLGAFRDTMRPDVVLELPGSSPLAGVHRGSEPVGRFLTALREVLRSAEKPITYEHHGEEMVVRHDIVLHGPKQQVEMVLRITIAFDPDGKATWVSVRPDDEGLFDHALRTALGDEGPG